MIDTAIVFFSGFREHVDALTGTARLHADCLREFASKETHVIDLCPWDHDTEELAGYIANLGCSRVFVVGYSWGGGFASQRFARDLAKRGIKVELMALCDPVYRPVWLPTCLPANVLAIRAMLPGSACIRIPANVDRVVGVRQKLNRPSGHNLKADSPMTEIRDFPVVRYTHTSIDESPQWHELVKGWFRFHLQLPKPKQ